MSRPHQTYEYAPDRSPVGAKCRRCETLSSAVEPGPIPVCLHYVEWEEL